VELHQIVFGVVIIIVLLAMAIFFAWRQGKTLRGLHYATEQDEDERRYLRRQAWRRLICSALMVVLAVLLAASFFLEDAASKLVREGESNQQQGIKRPLQAEEQRFLNLYQEFWGVACLVLFLIIVIAGIDYMAIRRYGDRQYRQIQADRKAMIESELARLRSQRNGHEA
jgi:ABC-type Fe3+ transport system permease subunit